MSMRMMMLALLVTGCKSAPQEEWHQYNAQITCERPLSVWVARYSNTYYCEGLLENGAYNCIDSEWKYQTVGAAEKHTYLVVRFGDSLIEARRVAEDCK